MGEQNEPQLPLQAAFTYESMRRLIKGADDLEKLREVALRGVDFMEAQQRTVLVMLRQQWLKPSDFGSNDL